MSVWQKLLVALAMCSAGWGLLPEANRAGAQDAETTASDLRRLHERVVYATVRIHTATGVGSGWLLAQSGRPLVVTNAHVARTVGRESRVYFYRGASEVEVSVPATRFHISRQIDLGILQLSEDPPDSARPVQLRTTIDVWRGERVVLGGNPSAGNGTLLPFQTTEGVVTGHVAGEPYRPCGTGNNCIVIDAASFQGSSGGPAFDMNGELVGMLWGGPLQRVAAGHGVAVVQNPAFSYLIHTRTIARELRSIERSER